MGDTNIMKTLNGYEIYDEAARARVIEVTTSGTGAAYVATVPGIKALVPGVSFVMVPHVSATVASPTVNVNGFGNIMVRQRLSNSATTVTSDYVQKWIIANQPIRLTYVEYGTTENTISAWVIDAVMPNLATGGTYGVLPVSSGGTGGTTVAEARNALGLGDTAGALPVECGGTGCTTIEEAKALFSIASTGGVVAIENGGTNADNAADALTNLGAAAASHEHSGADITSGKVDIAHGGTNADNAQDALTNLGAAAAGHKHSGADINSGIVDIAYGGTGAVNAAGARISLGITLENLGITYGTAEPSPTGTAGTIYIKYD